MRVVIDGLSHPHVQYFLEEIDLRGQDVELAAVRIYDEAERSLLPEWFDGYLCRSSDELLNLDPGVLLLSGPYSQRADVAVAGLSRGVHVLADKPLATTSTQLRRLREAARTSAGSLSIAFEKRWYPATVEAKRLIESGRIGQIRQISSTGPHKLKRETRPGWFFDEGYGSILSDLPVHDIDLVLRLTGGTSGTLTAWRSPGGPTGHPGFSDACAIAMTVEGCVWASIDANWVWPESSDVHGRYQMRITGTEGTVFIDWASNDVLLEGDVAENGFAMSTGEARGKRPSEEFFDALQEGRPPEVDTRAALLATYVAVTAAESADMGGRLTAWQFDFEA